MAGTATDLNWDTYILSGAAMMKDGECVRSGYPLDLDTLTVGSRVGELHSVVNFNPLVLHNVLIYRIGLYSIVYQLRCSVRYLNVKDYN